MSQSDISVPVDLFKLPDVEVAPNALTSKPLPSDPKFIDLRKLSPFGRWSILSYAGRRGSRHFWNCQCSCGTMRAVNGSDLRIGKSLCCGCAGDERTSERNESHGMSGTKAYFAWRNLRIRCENDPRYAHVSVCQGWRLFENFYADMGDAPVGPNDENRKRAEYSIDRINNEAGNYSCGHCAECIANGWTANCEWRTQRDQCRNQKRNRLFEYHGQKKTIAEWSEITKIHVQTLWYRINHGLAIAQAIETPLKTGGHPLT